MCTIFKMRMSGAIKQLFGLHPELAPNPAASKVLKAEVGFRVINTRDNVCLCARGANEYKKQVQAD